LTGRQWDRSYWFLCNWARRNQAYRRGRYSCIGNNFDLWLRDSVRNPLHFLSEFALFKTKWGEKNQSSLYGSQTLTQLISRLNPYFQFCAIFLVSEKGVWLIFTVIDWKFDLFITLMSCAEFYLCLIKFSPFIHTYNIFSVYSCWFTLSG
jgi:hypothetical protein